MKIKVIRSIVRLGLMIVSCVVSFSCSKDLPGALNTQDKEVLLKGLKLINVGEHGDVVLEGVIDELKKQVIFPRIDEKTDFSNLKFEAITSDGASLEKDIYSVDLDEKDPKKSFLIRVLNNPRFRDYMVSLELKIPPIGADFIDFQKFDYSLNPGSNGRYADFIGGNVRGSGFNGEYVLVVDRGNGVNPHLLKVSELKNNNINKIKLAPPPGETFIGGTFAVHSGQIVKEHIYVASLSGSNVSPLKIYHWTDPTKPADLILNTTTGTISGSASFRFGDNMSINLDNAGNGFAFFIDNGGVQVLKYKVTNYVNFSDGMIFPTGLANVGSWGSYNQIGNSSDYLFTGHQAPVRVMSGTGSLVYTASGFPERLSDVRVFTFNKERYIMGATAPRAAGENPVLNVYSINKGDDIVEALGYFAQGDKNPVFSYNLFGTNNGNPATQAVWYIEKDGNGQDKTLMLFAASVDAGFAFFEFGKKKDLED